MDKFKQHRFYRRFGTNQVYMFIDGVLEMLTDMDGESVIPSEKSAENWIEVEITSVNWKDTGDWS